MSRSANQDAPGSRWKRSEFSLSGHKSERPRIDPIGPTVDRLISLCPTRARAAWRN